MLPRCHDKLRFSRDVWVLAWTLSIKIHKKTRDLGIFLYINNVTWPSPMIRPGKTYLRSRRRFSRGEYERFSDLRLCCGCRYYMVLMPSKVLYKNDFQPTLDSNNMSNRKPSYRLKLKRPIDVWSRKICLTNNACRMGIFTNMHPISSLWFISCLLYQGVDFMIRCYYIFHAAIRFRILIMQSYYLSPTIPVPALFICNIYMQHTLFCIFKRWFKHVYKLNLTLW